MSAGTNAMIKTAFKPLTADQVTILKLCNELEKVHAECHKAFCSTDPREVLRVHNILMRAAKVCEAALDAPVFK